MNRTFPRPTRRHFNADRIALDAPLPLLVTCAGMSLPWPNGCADAPDVPLCAGCGGYVDACQCGAPGTPPSDWEPDTEDGADLFAADDFSTWPTLAQRLADSIRDDRAA